MEFVSTRTETEALLLEANLIKRLRPRFNVLLRDDKSFPYILITERPPGARRSPSIAARGAGRATISGRSPRPARSAARSIRCSARSCIRTCSDSVYESRTRPCLLHQIKRCSAPCTGVISLADYAQLVDEAKAFLSGTSQAVQAEMAREMEEAAERLDFEAAARLSRPPRRAVARPGAPGHQPADGRGGRSSSPATRRAARPCIQVFFFRTGQNWGNRAYFPRADKSLDCAAVLGAFLAQFYDDKPVPQADPAQPRHRGARAARRGALRAEPARGSRSPCRSAARRRTWSSTRSPMRARRWAASSPMSSSQTGAARRARRALRPGRAAAADRGLRQQPHHGHQRRRRDDRRRAGGLRERPVPQVQHPLGGPHAGRRLRHDARGARPPLRAAAARGRTAREARARTPRRVGPWPDLVLIDGGTGQLGGGERNRSPSSASPTCRSSASPRGRTAMPAARPSTWPGASRSCCQPRDPVLYFVQRLRDEAHRFAIGSHRDAAANRDGPQPARRDRRHRPDPQAGAAPPFRHRQGGQPRRASTTCSRWGASRGRWRRRSTTISTSRARSSTLSGT